jgi:hypothetical protein
MLMLNEIIPRFEIHVFLALLPFLGFYLAY